MHEMISFFVGGGGGGSWALRGERWLSNPGNTVFSGWLEMGTQTKD